MWFVSFKIGIGGWLVMFIKRKEEIYLNINENDINYCKI